MLGLKLQPHSKNVRPSLIKRKKGEKVGGICFEARGGGRSSPSVATLLHSRSSKKLFIITALPSFPIPVHHMLLILNSQILI